MKQCPICGERTSEVVLRMGEYTYLRCKRCDAVYLSPMPNAHLVADLYQSEAYFSGDGRVGYYDYAAMHKALLPLFQRRLAALSALRPSKGRLLDFGCADGYFLELARQQGWEITGVEISAFQAQYASSRLAISVFDSIEHFPESSFDVITLWEVLEHLTQPIVELRKLKSRLRPGGVLMMSTPNAGFWKAVHKPGEWSNFSPPAHLILFTERTLKLTLSSAGFASIEVRKGVPLPPMPRHFQRLFAPLEEGISRGTAPAWMLSLWLWRAIRLLAWAWQRAFLPSYDVFTSLEAVCLRPSVELMHE